MRVARRMSAPPAHSRKESPCPSTITPSSTAETGSNAPKMAVGVEPMSWRARVVRPNEITVGIIARAIRFAHPHPVAGRVRGVLVAV